MMNQPNTDEWHYAKKKPVVIRYRMVHDNGTGKEEIHTRESVLYGYKGQDVIIMGIKGELYPCKKDIFQATYDLLTDEEGKKGLA